MKTQRDRFESWAVAPPREWPVEKQPNSPSSAWPGQYVAHYVQCAWEAWQAACPEGWQVVPKEPDESMLATLHERVLISCNPSRQEASILNDRKLWSHLLAAAPKPEDVCKSPA